MKYYLSPKLLAILSENRSSELGNSLRACGVPVCFYEGWMTLAELECGQNVNFMVDENLVTLRSAICGDYRGVGGSIPERQWNSIRAREGESVRLLVVEKEFDGFKNRVCVNELASSNCQNEVPVNFIDLAVQQGRIRHELERSIAGVLDHGKYIMGPEVGALEAKLAEYVGVEHCITVASGTDSLLIALMALGVGSGDEVVTVPFTWISTAEVVALLGARPVFVDVDPFSWNLDPSKLADKITSRTKAIMPVGIFGQVPQMSKIMEIAHSHGDIPVIEDAAQCFGSEENGRRSCGLSQIGSTSFFPSKPLGCYGDGGALFTDDSVLAERMRQIRVHGQKKKHDHPIVGVNGRLDTLQAAVLLEKLALYDEERDLRNRVAAVYNQAVDQFNSTKLSRQKLIPGNTSVFAQYTVLAEDRKKLAERLGARGIPTVSYYQRPLHLQGAFSELGYSEGDFPVSEKIAETSLSLPMSPYLSQTDQDRIVLCLEEFVKD